MAFQFDSCIETHWTFTANIRLHSFMSLNVHLEVITAAEFLLTDVTGEPTTFIVWLQQMSLELFEPRKAFWTVSTWVRLCVSVNTNMILQFAFFLKQLPTITTIVRSTVAVYMTFVSLQVAGVDETLVTQWTLVRFLSRVDSHVIVQMRRLTKRLVTHVTFVRFLSTVNSAVNDKVIWPRKSFAANSTFKRFLSWVTSHVSFQLTTVSAWFATFWALEFTSMKIHMITQAPLMCETSVALSTWMQLICSVCFCVITQPSCLCVTAVVTWTLSDVIAISFSLHLNLLRVITVIRLSVNRLVIPCRHTTSPPAAAVQAVVKANCQSSENSQMYAITRKWFWRHLQYARWCFEMSPTPVPNRTGFVKKTASTGSC